MAFDNPLIGVILCQAESEGHPIQQVHNKYLDALFAAGGVPVALPHSLAKYPDGLNHVLNTLGGILLTGSLSNIEPHHYGDISPEPHTDPGRDRLAFALIGAIIERSMPLLAICRGLQELVVATGGALYPRLTPFYHGHHADDGLPPEQQYAAAHQVHTEPGGLLNQLLPDARLVQVNSLHVQGIRSLGRGLRIEARAPDGLIEAVSLRDHPFALAVQWHPEWHSEDNPLSQAIFNGFIRACQPDQKKTSV